MIRINQCKVSVPYTMQDVEKKVSQILHCKRDWTGAFFFLFES